MTSTANVLLNFSKGDKTAFDEIYAQYSAACYGICIRFSRCREDANDILQETFVKVYSNMKKYDISVPIEPWLKRITRNAALDYIKANYKYVLKEEESYFEEKGSTTDEVEFEDTASLMQNILENLQKMPDGYRTVFNLYFIENLTHKEIGEYLSVSENTSKTQLMNAKKFMKKLLETQKEMSHGI
jgi:RNA polymerase sigma factor (sigma-70 family)